MALIPAPFLLSPSSHEDSRRVGALAQTVFDIIKLMKRLPHDPRLDSEYDLLMSRAKDIK